MATPSMVKLADDIHTNTTPTAAIAAVAAGSSLDETQPAIPYGAPEVAAEVAAVGEETPHAHREASVHDHHAEQAD